ncbi:MAG: hypothetical protein LCH53_14420 [Bacteroidetes bacterium]|nr:hypothetical protein [Bacteroidota bacterium]
MRRFLLLALVAAAPFVAGCDSPNDEDGPYGVWAYGGSDIFYFNISKSAIVTYDYQNDTVDRGPDCYTSLTFVVTKIDGDRFTVSQGGTTATWTLSASGDNLTITFPSGSPNTFIRSSKKASDFTPACSAS